MTYKSYSKLEKEKILSSFCERIRDSLTPISEVCQQHDIAFRTISRWCADNPKWESLLFGATERRAWRYSEEAIGLIDNAPTYYEDTKGNKRDSNASVNKAKYQAEFRVKLAEILAPDVFGDMRHVIKQIEKQMAEIGNEIVKIKKEQSQ